MALIPKPVHGVLAIYTASDTSDDALVKVDAIRLESESIVIGSSAAATGIEITKGRISVSDDQIEQNHATLKFNDLNNEFCLTNTALKGTIDTSSRIVVVPGATLKIKFDSDFRIGRHTFRLLRHALTLPATDADRSGTLAEPDPVVPVLTEEQPKPEASLTATSLPNRPVETLDERSATPSTPAFPPVSPPVTVEPPVIKGLEASQALPNGMVGTDYQTRIPNLKLSEISNVTVEISADLGLRFQFADDCIVISGTPSTQGDHDLTVTYSLPERPARAQRFSVFVNPNPRSMWKTLPCDPESPYQKSHTDSDRIDVGDSTLIAASCRGRSHAHEGSFRDDHFLLDSRDGWHLIAVSDGAGSAKFSREGSRIACETARREIYQRLSLLEELLAEQPESGIRDASKADIKEALYSILGNAGKKIFEDISTEATLRHTEFGAKPNDYAATIIYCIYKKFQFGWFVAAFAIGDGGVAIYDDRREVKVLNTPDGGEYAGQTRFATMPHIWESEPEITGRIQVSIVDHFTSIVAMTDGVSDPKFGTDKNFFATEYWRGVWQSIVEAVNLQSESSHEELLGWLDFWSTGNHDDRTIAIGILKNG